MKQEDKQLLLKDLCARLPYRVITYNEDKDIKDKCTDCPFNDTSCPGGMFCTEED